MGGLFDKCFRKSKIIKDPFGQSLLFLTDNTINNFAANKSLVSSAGIQTHDLLNPLPVGQCYEEEI